MKGKLTRADAFQAGQYYFAWVNDVRFEHTGIIGADLGHFLQILQLRDRIEDLIKNEAEESFVVVDNFHPLPNFEKVLGREIANTNVILLQWFDIGRNFSEIKKETPAQNGPQYPDWWVPRFRAKLENANVNPADRDRVERAINRSIQKCEFESSAETLREIARDLDHQDKERDEKNQKEARENMYRERESKTNIFERIVSASSAFIIALLVVYLLYRNQPIASSQLFFVLRVALSFMVAVLGASIPGLFKVSYSAKGFAVRGGGAVALFILTYIYTPALVS